MPLEDVAVELHRQLGGIEAEVAALSQTIAAELLEQPPRQSQRIAAARLRITQLAREFAPLSQRIVATQAEAAAQAREAGIPRLPQPWYDLATRAHLFRGALNRWGEVQRLIDAQQPPRRRPLYRVAKDAEDVVAAQAVATDALLRTLHGILTPTQDAGARALGAYPDIAMPHGRFVAHLHAASRVALASDLARPEFLDIGCGNGMKVLAAAELFFRATGLELDPGYAEAARRLLAAAGRDDCRVVELDAALFPDYRFYQVVYLFRPMQDDAAMHRLEEIVVSQLRPGTIVIAPYRGFAARHAGLGCAEIERGLYLAGTDAEAAAGLRAAAEHTGAFFGRKPPDLADVWEPVLAASAARGFGLRSQSWADNV